MATSTIDPTDVATFEVVGCAMPLRAFIARKSGNKHYGLASVYTSDGVTTHKDGTTSLHSKGDKYIHPYGRPLPALAETLPTSATINGVKVYLTPGVIEAEGKAPRAKVTHKGHVTLPTGEIKMLDATISVTKDGAWNYKVSLRNPGEGGTGRVVGSYDDL